MKKNLHLVTSKVLNQSFDLINPGKKTALLIFPGGLARDNKRFKKGKIFAKLCAHDKYTILMYNWNKYFYFPELIADQIEDLYMQKQFSSLYLFGTSIGGMCAIELLADIFRKKRPLKISGLITILSPYDISDLRLQIRMKLLFTRVLNFAKKSQVTIIPKKSEISDIRSYYSHLPVLAITSSGFDPLIKNNRAAEKMRFLFQNLKIKTYAGKHIWYKDTNSLLGKFNPYGSHLFENFERPKLHSDVIRFLCKN